MTVKFGNSINFLKTHITTKYNDTVVRFGLRNRVNIRPCKGAFSVSTPTLPPNQELSKPSPTTIRLCQIHSYQAQTILTFLLMPDSHFQRFCF